jgi:lipoprotein-anchoring transpeptidase ErfK/SrfK
VLRRILLLFVALLVASVPLAQAGDPPPPPSTEPPAESPPDPQPPTGPLPEPVPVTSPLFVPDGVSVGNVLVGGMTAEQATLTLQSAFDQPLEFRHGFRRWTVRPELLGARAYIDGAVERALLAVPGSRIDLVVTVRGQDVRDYVASLDASFSRPAQDSRLRLVKLKPKLTPGRPGFKVTRAAMTAEIVRALRSGDRGPLRLSGNLLRPKVTPSSYGPVVVIRRESKKLILYKGERLWKRFGVATGQASYPTPIGRFEVVVKWRNPWWYPPASDWARGQKPIPPGPGNPLGTRWMGLSAPLVGIHGTPDAASIGYSASHGCIRMLIPDAEWLFDNVRVGTTVFIVRA